MNNFVLILFFAVTTISCSLMLFFLMIWVRAKTIETDFKIKHQCSIKSLTLLDNIIRSSVITTNHSMVNKLKKSENFYQLDKEEAFVQTRSSVLKLCKNGRLLEQCEYVDDLDEWINNRIEYHVQKNKIL